MHKKKIESICVLCMHVCREVWENVPYFGLSPLVKSFILCNAEGIIIINAGISNMDDL